MSTSAPNTPNDARIDVRLPSELKRIIQEAAVVLGQTVSGFVISTMLREARTGIREARLTRLSRRDRDRFLRVLDSTDARPNAALKAAAARYKKRLGLSRGV